MKTQENHRVVNGEPQNYETCPLCLRKRRDPRHPLCSNCVEDVQDVLETSDITANLFQTTYFLARLSLINLQKESRKIQKQISSLQKMVTNMERKMENQASEEEKTLAGATA